MTILDGTVARRLDGGFVVAFDRLIGRPAEKVWAALTDPKILADWLGEVQTARCRVSSALSRRRRPR